MPPLFHRFLRNIITIFSGRNLLWHTLAIVLTVGIVMSGGDWAYFRATRSESIFRIALPALRLGFFVPILGIMYFLVVAVLARVRRLVATAWALGQAALLGYLIASMYKAFTGRLPPPSFRHYTAAAPAIPMVDSSHGFQLGFWRGGIFWGWPSSHTTVAFSMSLCLLTLYPKKKVVALLALVYAFYIGLSVSVTIHWLSEFVAGAIIGSVIGVAVGRSFRDKLAPLAP